MNNEINLTDNTQFLKDYYATKYGAPSTDVEAIDILVMVYEETMGKPNKEVIDGIAEYYRMLQQRNLPAYEWLLEAFHVTSKKAESKRNFSYCVGMVRAWLKHGFGYLPNQEEEDLISYFKDKYGYELSLPARRVLQRAMGTHGSVRLARAIGETEAEVDVSLQIVLMLEEALNNKYSNTTNQTTIYKQVDRPATTSNKQTTSFRLTEQQLKDIEELEKSMS